MPCAAAVPKFLADTKYVNPADVTHSAFQIAHRTELPAFIWGFQQPRMVEDLIQWMGAVYADRPTTFLDAFDISKHVEGSKDEDVIFVDVAGSVGHQCALLKGKLPKLRGRVILEDLPPVVASAIPLPGLEPLGIDMWQGQPVKGLSLFQLPDFAVLLTTSIGAKTYYMRMILHDYPDAKAIELLRLQAEAMSPNSVLVIDELVVPNQGAHGHATQFDLTMLASLASIERTDKQWDTLIDAAGFQILEKKAYAPAGESVIVIKPKA